LRSERVLFSKKHKEAKSNSVKLVFVEKGGRLQRKKPLQKPSQYLSGKNRKS